MMGRFHAAATRASAAQLSSGPIKAKAPPSLKAVIRRIASAAYSGAVLLPVSAGAQLLRGIKSVQHFTYPQ